MKKVKITILGWKFADFIVQREDRRLEALGLYVSNVIFVIISIL